MKPSTMAFLSCLAIVLAACSDNATSTSTPTSPRSLPAHESPTVGVGFTQISDVRGNVGPFHVQSKLDGFDVELKSHDDADIEISNQIGMGQIKGKQT